MIERNWYFWNNGSKKNCNFVVGFFDTIHKHHYLKTFTDLRFYRKIIYYYSKIFFLTFHSFCRILTIHKLLFEIKIKILHLDILIYMIIWCFWMSKIISSKTATIVVHHIAISSCLITSFLSFNMLMEPLFLSFAVVTWVSWKSIYATVEIVNFNAHTSIQNIEILVLIL